MQESTPSDPALKKMPDGNQLAGSIIRNRRNGELKGALLAEHSVSGRLVYKKEPGSFPKKRGADIKNQSFPSSLNTICPYYTMFPLQFPVKHLASARKDEWVLDPFCGRGTTVFAARLHGLDSVGIDSNPVAAAIAAAKLVDTTPKAIIGRAQDILSEGGSPSEIPGGQFWDMCFHPDTLRDICALREHFLRNCSTDEDVALRAIVLGILHGPKRKTVQTYLSNQMPRTYATKPEAAIRFWQKHGLTEPPAVNVLDAIDRRARYTFASIPPASDGAVYLADARCSQQLLSGWPKFSWVITSPPYLGMRTYQPDQWLRNWFLGGEPRVCYAQDGQLSHHSEKFTDELAGVWRAVANRCHTGAYMIVRFGYLPSIPVDAREMLRSSFEKANCGWRIIEWRDAGSSLNGKRQSQQFGRCVENAAHEIDAHARLEG